MGPRASRSSVLRGFLDASDGSGGVDVLTMFSKDRVSSYRPRSPPERLLVFWLVPSHKRPPHPTQAGQVRSSRQRTQAVFFRDAKGLEPVDAFLEELLVTNPLAAAKIDEAIEEHLNGRRPSAPPPEFPISSQIERELRELRVRFGRTRYRLLYQRSENLIVLLHLFKKNTGAVPTRDVEMAKKRMMDFRARMDDSNRRRPRAAGRDAPPKSRSAR